MQYLVSVIDDRSNSGSEDEMAAVDAFNDGVRAAGQWVIAGGLADPTSAVVIDARGATPVTTEGPFVETAEFTAGFWIFEVDSEDEAIRLATAGSKACNRKVEVRAFLR